MTMIEPTRRPDSGPPRLHERPDADSQFGAELNAAVARREPERNLRARRHDEDRRVAEPRPDAERDVNDTGSTDSTSTDPVDAPSTTSATRAAEAGDESVELPNDAVPVAASDGSTVGADEPRINNGGACSCCTPGALRSVLAPTTTASQAGAVPSDPIFADPNVVADPGDAADGAASGIDGGFPPPRPSPTPGMPPPAGPPVPLPTPLESEVALPVDLMDDSVAPVPPDLESEDMSTADPDDLRLATTPVAGDPAMAALVTVPVPQQAAVTTAVGAPTSSTATAVTGVVVGSVTAAVATSTDAGTDTRDGDESSAGTGADGSGSVTSTQQTGAELAASRITATASQPVSSPVAPLPGQSVSQGVLRSEQVRVLRELAPNRDVQRLAVDLDGARIALRFDSTGARVDVVADPGNRLGHGWADDVQRTLNAGARQGANAQQRDPDGGRRNRQAYQAPNQVDERLAAEFSARLGAVEEG